MKTGEDENPSADDIKEQMEFELTVLKKLSRDRYLAIAYLTRCDTERVGEYVINLHNDYIGGDDRHPTTLTAAYNAVINYKHKDKPSSKSKKQHRDDKNQDRTDNDNSKE